MPENSPMLYIGTLFSGENEFADCKKAIQNQTYRNFKHFVFSFLPNKEAHQVLYQDFLAHAEYEILIKIDADTVLYNDQIFEKIIEDFKSNRNIQHINYRLADFYTRTIIRGLNVNRNGFQLIKKKDMVFVDRIIKYEMGVKLDSNEIVGFHSPAPSDYQAFHFGFHRQLKNQNQIISDIVKSYLLTFNKKRVMAICGAVAVMKGNLKIENNDIYSDIGIKNEFDKICSRHNYAIYFFQYIVLRIFVRIKMFINRCFMR